MSDAVSVFEALEPFRKNARVDASKFQLEAMREALEALDNPQDRMGRTVHITGTNGKGSTLAFMRAMAEAAGLKVHAFSSPHLIRVNERIRVAGELVSDEALVEALDVVAETGAQLSYFEALAAAAFWLFAETRADLTLIEVGAGGTGDATNVMKRPSVCVITPISRDHEGLFGVSGVAAIARLKAGIMRQNVPIIVGEQDTIVTGVLNEEARKTKAQVIAAGRQWNAVWEDEAFVFSSDTTHVRAPWLGINGRRQVQNAGVACAAILALKDARITPEEMSAGLRGASWPGRQQRLGEGPLTKGYEGGIWIDAAHNTEGAKSLVETIRSQVPEKGVNRVAVILAVQGAKDYSGMLEVIADIATDVIACPLPDSGGQEGGPGAPPDDLVEKIAANGVHGMTATDFLEAIQLAKASNADRIYVCGSVYLCGAVLAANGELVV